MRLEVAAAGYLASWEFSGSLGFESWAKERPWLGRGGLCAIRSSSQGAADLFYLSICSVLRAAHGDERRLRIQRVDCGGDSGTPMQAVLASMELDPGLNPFEARNLLEKRFLDRPTVFVISEKAEVPAQAWTELVMLVEHFGKRTPVVPLCVVALDTRNVLQHDPAFDFSVGRCTHMLLAGAVELDEPLIWRSYLHHRSCWESGGDPSLAQRWGDELAVCRLGDDDGVESVLNACVQQSAEESRLDGLLQAVRSAMDRFAPGRDKARQQLREHRLLWRPPGLQRLELTPWASRALLLNGKAPVDLVQRLRHNLVCMPLASEILAHCLNAEAKIRMQLEGKQTRAPDDKILKSFERFRKGESTSVVYPRGHPSPPVRPADVWNFAGLGETMNACENLESKTALWETVHLRNAMAHGHYVTWSHVRRALQQSRRFDV